MLLSNGTQSTIQYFLNLIKIQSPGILPSIFMTNHNHAQVNTICAVFPKYQHIFYCWWHVLQAIQTHFNTKEFLDLWTLIQNWVCVTDGNQFNTYWTQIQKNTEFSKSIANYIAQEWLPYKEIWSIVSHQNYSIFEKGNTNMLLEAYVIMHFQDIYLFTIYYNTS